MSYEVRGGDGSGTGGTSGGGTGSPSFGAGIAAGALAWVVGAAVLFVIGQLGLIGFLSFIIGFTPVFGTIAAYLSIHSWLITGLSSGYAAGSGGSIFVLVLLTCLPIMLLFIAGIASSVGNRQSALIGGIAVTIGYGLMTFMSLFLLIAIGGGFDPGSMVIHLAITGVVFPIVFGTAGAALG